MNAYPWYYRLSITLVLVLGVFFVPWYIPFAIAGICAWIFPRYIEWIGIGILIDSLFITPALFGFGLWYTTGAIVGIVLIYAIKRTMM